MHSKLLLTGLMFLCSTMWLQGQEVSAEEEVTEQKFHFGAYAGINATSGKAKDAIFTQNGITSKIVPGYGFDLGLIGQYALSKILSLELAPGYSQQSLSVEVDGIVFGSDIDPVLGIISSSSLTSNLTMNSINLPFYARFQVLDERLSIFSGAEYHFIFNGNSETKTILGNGTVTTSGGGYLASSNASIPLGLGWKFKLKNDLSLGFDLKANYYVLPMNYTLILTNLVLLHFSSRFIF